MSAKAKLLSLPHNDRAALEQLCGVWGETHQRMAALEKDQQDLRRRFEQVVAQVADLRGQVDTLNTTLATAAEALAATAQTTAEAAQRETQFHEEIGAAFRAQFEYQAALAKALESWRTETDRQLAAFVNGETALQERLSGESALVAEALRGLAGQTAARLDQTTQAVDRLIAVERENAEQSDRAARAAAESETGLTEALHGVGNSAAGLVRRVDELLSEQRLAHQEEALREAQRLNRLGLKCISDGRYFEAAAAFEKAVALVPHAPEPAFNLTLAHYLQKDFATALRLVEPQAETHPTLTRFGFLRGLIRLAQGDHAGARRDLSEIAGRALTDHNVQAATGVAHLLASDPAGAIEAFRRAVQGVPVLQSVGLEPETSCTICTA